MKVDLSVISESSSIKQAVQRYIFMTSVYGWLTVGLIIASKKQLLHESQIVRIIEIIFNGGLDFEFFAIVFVSIIFSNGVFSFVYPIESRKFALKAIGAIILTLGELTSCMFVLYHILFNGTWIHTVFALFIWFIFGAIGIIISDFRIFTLFFKKIIHDV